MINRKQILTIFIVIALITTCFVAIYYFSVRDVVYKFTMLDKSNGIMNVDGLVRTYDLDSDKEGKIYEIERWVMSKDIVDIKVKAPKNIHDFSSVRASLIFENPNNPTLLFGIKKKVDMNLGEDVYNWDYNFIDNHYLNEFKSYLGAEWTYLLNNKSHVIVFQKEQKYRSVDEFLNSPPKKAKTTKTVTDEFGLQKLITQDIAQIATVDYRLKQNFSLKNNDVLPNYTKIAYSFRGGFDTYVYFDKKRSDSLEISFIKQDLNFKEGEDIYEMKVYDYRGKLVYYKIFVDDGITDDSKVVNTFSYKESIPLEDSGLYYVRFVNSNKDSMIRNISISSAYVMLNNFIVVDFDGFGVSNIITKPLTMFAMPGKITIFPEHPNANQKVTVNGRNYDLDHFNKIKTGSFDLYKKLNQIITTKNDLKIKHSLHPIALNSNSLFDIYPNLTTNFKTISKSNINYVVALYNFPTIDDGKEKNYTEFDAKDIFVDNDGFIHFRIKADGLSGYGNTIYIDSMEITLLR